MNQPEIIKCGKLNITTEKIGTMKTQVWALILKWAYEVENSQNYLEFLNKIEHIFGEICNYQIKFLLYNTYLWTATNNKMWQIIPTEKIGTKKNTYSGTNCIEVTMKAISIIISHRAIALTPIECSIQQQHRLTWQQAMFLDGFDVGYYKLFQKIL